MAAPRLPESGADDVLYVVDVSSLVFRAYHALPPLSSSKGEPTHAVAGVNQMLQRLLDERKPKHVVIAMDSKGKTFRHVRYPEYKANRPEAPPDLSSQIGWVRRICDAWGFVVLEKEGFEADDLIATTTRLARERGMRVVIVSADKDLLQLVGDGVLMVDTMRNRVFGRDETLEKMLVPPEQVRDLLALVGDASDNVPGVPSVGPKTAAKLLAEYGSLDGIYAALDTIKAKGTREKLGAHKDEAYLSRELVTLDEHVELDGDIVGMPYEGGHPEALRALYLELELVRALAQSEPKKQEVVGRYDLATTDDAVRALGRAIREGDDLGVHLILDVDDPHRALMLGVGLSWSDGVATYVPLAPTRLGQAVPSPDASLAVLRPLFENALLPKHAGDGKREAYALASVGLTLRGIEGDVGLLGYLLDPDRGDQTLVTLARAELSVELGNPLAGPKAKASDLEPEALARFACEQADFARRLGRVMLPRVQAYGLGALYRDLERPLVDVLVRLEQAGVRVDLALLARLGAEAAAGMAELEARCTELAGHAFNVGSPRQLETVLFDELGLPVLKRTKTARSTDHEVLEELAEQHALPQVILDHRSLAKLKGTYLDALPLTVDPRTGRIHSHFEQTVAATGRISSKDPNLQNIPIRTELGQRIRHAFVAEPGHLVLSADYSQIELRVLAHLSEDPELCDAYQKADDVHTRTASALFGVPQADVTKAQRGAAKTVNFAVIYGQTEVALARNLRIDRAEARRYIEAFFERYAGVKRFLDEVTVGARDRGFVTTLFGRRRTVADIHSRNPQLRAAAERVARNTPIQGTAADLIKRAMLDIDAGLRREALRSRMILTVHDELVFELVPDERPQLEALVRGCMSGAAELRVPLEVSVGVGPSWGDAH